MNDEDIPDYIKPNLSMKEWCDMMSLLKQNSPVIIPQPFTDEENLDLQEEEI